MCICRLSKGFCLLSIIYVNDICHAKELYDLNVKMYADDTVIHTSDKNVYDVQLKLQNCLNYVNDWCVENRLYMNMKKTKIMWFSKGHRHYVQITLLLLL